MRRSALALSLAALVSADRAAAATFVATSVEEMARSSDAVVRGVVSWREARLTPGGRIVTDVDVVVASAWKGAPDEVVRLVVPGGSLGWIALAVDAAPSFEVGEEVVVFLARTGRAYAVAGHALGKFRVRGPAAEPSLGGARVLRRALPAGEREIGTMDVSELERRVRAAR
jgi:hypothetical protein